MKIKINIRNVVNLFQRNIPICHQIQNIEKRQNGKSLSIQTIREVVSLHCSGDILSMCKHSDLSTYENREKIWKNESCSTLSIQMCTLLLFGNRSLGAFWAPTSSWKPYGPIFFFFRFKKYLFFCLFFIFFIFRFFSRRFLRYRHMTVFVTSRNGVFL